VLRADFSPLLAPEPNEGCLVAPHDDPGVRAADETAPSRRIGYFLNVTSHQFLLGAGGGDRVDVYYIIGCKRYQPPCPEKFPVLKCGQLVLGSAGPRLT